MTLNWLKANVPIGGKMVRGFVHPDDNRYFIRVKVYEAVRSKRFLMYYKGYRVGEAVDLRSAKEALEALKAANDRDEARRKGEGDDGG